MALQSPAESQPRSSCRLAILGCGTLARQVLLPTLGRIPDVEIAAIADPDAAARDAALALAPAARSFADWRDAVAQDVDAVVVALPTALHAEAALAAMEAGRHLYLEKPIAATLKDGLRVAETARRVGHLWAGLKPSQHTGTTRVASVGFNYRFNPLIVQLRRRLLDERIGAPRVIRTVFSTQATPGATWRRPDAPGGGVLLDLGSHHVDLLRYITGDEVVSVNAERTVSSGGAERVALEIQLARGAVVQSTFATGAENADRIEIDGERGTLTVDRYRSWIVKQDGPGVSRRSSPPRGLRELGGWRYALEKHSAPWHEPSFGRALTAFVAAARGADVRGASLEDGLRSLEVIDAAERACRERRHVEVTARP